MSFLDKLPIATNCCGCIKDLKTATAIIAVLGIVASPAVSWAIVRHAYVVRVSCVVTTSASRPDVFDINLNNALSFGLGANAGLSSSCLAYKIKNSTNSDNFLRTNENNKINFVHIVKYAGWIVLLTDICFLLSSINLLLKMYKSDSKKAAKMFILFGLTSIILSFLYGLLYVTACVSLGGPFPFFEFLFAIIDLLLWMYYLVVVSSFRRGIT